MGSGTSVEKVVKEEIDVKVKELSEQTDRDTVTHLVRPAETVNGTRARQPSMIQPVSKARSASIRTTNLCLRIKSITASNEKFNGNTGSYFLQFQLTGWADKSKAVVPRGSRLMWNEINVDVLFSDIGKSGRPLQLFAFADGTMIAPDSYLTSESTGCLFVVSINIVCSELFSKIGKIVEYNAADGSGVEVNVITEVCSSTRSH